MPAYQIPNFAPIGSLLKRPRPRAKRLDLGRNRRIEEPAHLQAIRQCPCLRCGVDGFTEAAHVRLTNSAANKRSGLGVKPDDKWTVPLCTGCHQRDPDSQHNVGELTFWHHVGINPLLVCEALHKASPNVEAMRVVVFKFIRERTAVSTANAVNIQKCGENP